MILPTLGVQVTMFFGLFTAFRGFTDVKDLRLFVVVSSGFRLLEFRMRVQSQSVGFKVYGLGLVRILDLGFRN